MRVARTRAACNLPDRRPIIMLDKKKKNHINILHITNQDRSQYADWTTQSLDVTDESSIAILAGHGASNEALATFFNKRKILNN